MTTEWKDLIAGARMNVDREFSPRVRDSQFSNQQWGLIMTAVEFELENPGNPDSAKLVANTDKIEHILPELDNVSQQMGMGQPSPGRSQQGDGLLSQLKEYIPGGNGNGDSVDEERLNAASTLVDEYAQELQTYLKDEGRWEQICEAASNAE